MITVKPLEWKHDGSRYHAYCGVTDTTWTAENQEGRDRAEQTRAARIMSAIEPAGVGVETPPPSSHLMGVEAALKGLLSIISDSDGVSGYEPDRATPWDEFPEVEAARLTLSTMNREEPHPDDLAVDRFAAAMKAKLAKKRDEGRGGWEDKEHCSNGFLSELLLEHVAKGDPVDVGNLAMMVHQRGESICVLTERVAAISQLHAIVDAWEELPGGRQVKNSDVERWLAKHMGPGIDAIRGFLRRPRPDGVLLPSPQPRAAVTKEATHD